MRSSAIIPEGVVAAFAADARTVFVEAGLDEIALPAGMGAARFERSGAGLDAVATAARQGGVLLVVAPGDGAELLLDLARRGVFAGPGRLHASGAGLAAVLGYRDYRLRPAVDADLPALLRLEEQCWAGPLRADDAELRRRLATHADGNMVAEAGGEVVGCVFSQRIDDLDRLQGEDFRSVGRLHQDGGRVMQLLAANVLPQAQERGLGDQLVEFMLHYGALRPGVERVAAVTLCRDYPRHAAGMALEDYIHAKTSSGLTLDPILRFHVLHGARIRGLVAGYRPADTANLGHGVLIDYDMAQRRDERSRAVAAVVARPVGADALAAVLACMAELKGEALPSHSASRPFKELGFDSLDLLGLRVLLERRFDTPVDPTAFFVHPSPDAIAGHLGGSGGPGTAASALSRVRARASSTLAPERVPGVRQPVAIIGMACRFPGGVTAPEHLWDMLSQGREGVGEIPEARRRLVSWPEDEGLRHGGFLDGVDRFDAAFFKISPREAQTLDPQQRLLLELGWEALEDAGIDPTRLRGQPVGAFVGLFARDYEQLVLRGPAGSLDLYAATGTAPSAAAGRLAYVLGLRGPVLTVDTACSSSLVALHLACRSLAEGECGLALAAGVNLILTPDLGMAFSRAGMLAPDGRCKTFDAAADGYVRSEGAATLVLKPLDRALADGDRIHGVIEGSAINHDGASNGLTAPNGTAQEEVLLKALDAAGVAPAEIQMFEAHGTGTRLGDPVEFNAVAAVYGGTRAPGEPLVLGSVKTNIGHTEATAGLAGVVKAVLALRHRHIPPSLHLRAVNELIALDRIPAVIPTGLRPWPQPGCGVRRAAVSSFGFSGTNAHVVLHEPPEPAASDSPREAHPLVLSARSEPALRTLAESYKNLSAPLADVACTATLGRHHFEHRLGLAAADTAEMSRALADWLEGREGPARSARVSAAAPPVVFLFTGQGSQYAGMARRLYETEPAFADALDRCAAILDERMERGLLDVLYGEASGRIDETGYAQPALFAVEYALAAMWREFGLRPAAVLGHSVGEYVAACVAGAYSLEDGLALIAARGRLMQALPKDGAMVAALCAEDVAVRALSGLDAGIAAVNGPESVVLSGNKAAVAAAVARLEQAGVRTVPLATSHAFHSALMDPMLEEFGRVAAGMAMSAPAIPLISSVTGEALAGVDAAYWVGQVRRPVLFARALETASRLMGRAAYLEIGPATVLTDLGRRFLPEENCIWLGGLSRGRPDWRAVAETAASASLHGIELDWPAFHRGHAPARAALPTYPFERAPHWVGAAARVPAGGHPLLGAAVESPLPERLFAGSADAPFLADHGVGGEVVMPLAGYIEMALAAGADTIEDVVAERPLVLDGATGLRSVLRPDGAFEVFSRAGSDWVRHMSARLGGTAAAAPAASGVVLSPADPAAFYAQCRDQRGITYGPAFQALTALDAAEGEAGATIILPEAAEARGYRLHPVLLDACFQAAIAAFPASFAGAAMLPFSISRLTLRQPGATTLRCRVVCRASAQGVSCDLEATDAAGAPVVTVEGLVFRRTRRDAETDGLFIVEWVPDTAADGAEAPLPPMSELAALADAAYAAEAPQPADLLERMETLALAYAGAGLRRLGVDPEHGFDPDAVADRIAARPHHRRLLGRIAAMLAEAPLPQAEPATLRAALLAAHPGAHLEADLLTRCGEHLAEVLQDTANPLDLLFPEGDLTKAADLYTSSLAFAPPNRVLAQVVAGIARARPEGRPLRILEIGAGTGGTTAHVLRALPAGSRRYTFTDVGTLFLAQARERFGEDGIDYRLLDVGRPPLEQGFAEHGYDVVIAANAVHATPDLEASVAHIRQLLAPGGLMMLVEGTERRRWIDLIFGLTDGWWCFGDAGLRPDYPLLGNDAWVGVTRRLGFAEGATLDSSSHGLFQQSLVVARAERMPEDWIVIGKADGLAGQLAGAVQAAGGTCAVYPAVDAEIIAASPRLSRLVDLTAAEGEGVTTCSAALAAVKALAARPRPARLALVTRDAQPVAEGDTLAGIGGAPLWGLARVIELEHPELSCFCLDMDAATDAERLRREIAAPPPGERKIALRQGRRWVARLRPHGAGVAPGSKLVVREVGNLDTLDWVAQPMPQPGPGQIAIDVCATGLNFLDVMDALGVLPFERKDGLGAECAGIVTAVGPGVERFRVGDAVMAVAAGGFADRVVVPAALAAPKPHRLGFAEAATIPIAFLTAFHALRVVAGIKAGDRVLVHAATGGTGMAAVRIAQLAGAEVLGTTSAGKRALLASMGVGHIMDSRSLAFAEETMAITGGRGVDIVLNSLAGEAIARSLSVVASGGAYIEIGKTGVWSAEDVRRVRPDIAYHLVDLLTVCRDDPAHVAGMFAELSALLDGGELAPLPCTVFPQQRVAAAFRAMQQGRHTGKLVIERVPAGGRGAEPAFRSDGSYLVTGGLGGLGPLLAGWMAGRGAGRIVLAGRGAPNAATGAAIAELRAGGADIAVERLDVLDEAAVGHLLDRLDASDRPLRGIIHSVGILHDAALLRQTDETFAAVMAPKVQGALNLHRQSAGRALDHFVLFSSSASLLGTPGQGNHAAANAFLDALAAARRVRGQCGLSINWGAWADVGAAAERDVGASWRARGIELIEPARGLAAFGAALCGGQAQMGVVPIRWPQFLSTHGHDAFFAGFRARVCAAARPQPAAPEETGVIETILAAPKARRLALITAHVVRTTARILRLDPAAGMDEERGFFELGMDSLTAIELRNRLQGSLNCRLPSSLAFDFPTIADLSAHLLAGIDPGDSAPPESQPLQGPVPQDPVDMAALAGEIGAMSDDDIQQLLMTGGGAGR